MYLASARSGFDGFRCLLNINLRELIRFRRHVSCRVFPTAHKKTRQPYQVLRGLEQFLKTSQFRKSCASTSLFRLRHLPFMLASHSGIYHVDSNMSRSSARQDDPFQCNGIHKWRQMVGLTEETKRVRSARDSSIEYTFAVHRILPYRYES
jgi:hypothetical protein